MTAPERLTSTEGMTSEEISEALAEGRLDGYLATKNRKPVEPVEPAAVPDADQGARPTPSGPPTAGMTSGEIVEALERGALDDYLREPRR